MTDGRPPLTLPTERLGPYRLLALLGSGGMGTVYRAVDERSGETVAIKLIHQHLVAKEPAFLELFQREADVARRLRCPFTVHILDYASDQGQVYLVTEFVEGGSLAERLERQERLSARQALTIATQVAQALEEADLHGVVHRDLKPGNILLRRDESVKLADFGLARMAGAATIIGDLGGFAGTPTYAAPEQHEGRADSRSDIYSLGVVLFKMLTGEAPFIGPTPAALARAHATEPVPVARLAGLPPAVIEVVTRCLAKEPAERYQNPSELVAALAMARRAGAAGALTPTPPPDERLTPVPLVNERSEPRTTLESPSLTLADASLPPPGSRPEPLTTLDGPSLTLADSTIQRPAPAPAGAPAFPPPLTPLATAATSIDTGPGATAASLVPAAMPSQPARSDRPASAPPADRLPTSPVAPAAVARRPSRLLLATLLGGALVVSLVTVAVVLVGSYLTAPAATSPPRLATVPATAPAPAAPPATTVAPAGAATAAATAAPSVAAPVTRTPAAPVASPAVTSPPATATTPPAPPTASPVPATASPMPVTASPMPVTASPVPVTASPVPATTVPATAPVSVTATAGLPSWLAPPTAVPTATVVAIPPPNSPPTPTTGPTRGPAARAAELLRQARPVYGPVDGALRHQAGQLTYDSANRTLPDLVVEVMFINPARPAPGAIAWSHGVGIRVEPEVGELRIIIDATGEWTLTLAETEGEETSFTRLAGGRARSLRSGPNESNQLQLIALEAEGYLLVNGELVATLDLDDWRQEGDIYVGTGFLTGSEQAGETTGYRGFVVKTLKPPSP